MISYDNTYSITVIEQVFLPTAYIQQVGRTGRTGKQATAILFFNNNDVGRPD